MNEIVHPEQTKHVLVKYLDGSFSYFVVEPQQQFSTVHEIIGIFNNVEDLKKAYPELNYIIKPDIPQIPDSD